MRKIAAALLLAAALPLFGADPPPRETNIKYLVQMSQGETIERGVINVIIDALIAQSATKEQKEQLEQLRLRAMARNTSDTWTSAFDRAFDDKSIAKLIGCYDQRMIDVVARTLQETIPERLRANEPTVAERDRKAAKRTMDDLRALATAIEARATDTNEYPETSDMETLRKLVEPIYMHHMPSKDAWGHDFIYIGTPDHKSYRIVSAGADSVFDPQSRQLNQVPARETDRFEDDIVFQDGEFLQFPRGFLKNEQE